MHDLFHFATDNTMRPRALAALRRIPIRIGRDRGQIISLGLQLLLHFLDRPVELLIFAAEFFRRIVIDHDVGIDTMPFDDPIFAVLRIRRELGLEKVAAVSQRQRVANADDSAPGAFADQFTQTERLEPERKDVAVGGGELVDQRHHRAE